MTIRDKETGVNYPAHVEIGTPGAGDVSIVLAYTGILIDKARALDFELVDAAPDEREYVEQYGFFPRRT